jgi:phosphoribosyl 1,2-cyclic phosphodiesterase
MVQVCAIASGSNGNCYYVGNETDAILVDVGINRKQVLIRMAKAGIDVSKVRAIFISHEHSDHTRGVKVLAKVLNIPVYMTQKTFDVLWNPHRPGVYRLFEPGQPVQVASITVHPFLKRHDAVEPCSFRVETQGKNVGVLTDIGESCANVSGHFAKCDAVFLESNYDEQMLWEGTYPYVLKRRVASSVGHLSNVQALGIVTEHASERLAHIILSHLSGENNTPEMARSAFNVLNGRYSIHLTSRHDVSVPIEI